MSNKPKHVPLGARCYWHAGMQREPESGTIRIEVEGLHEPRSESITVEVGEIRDAADVMRERTVASALFTLKQWLNSSRSAEELSQLHAGVRAALDEYERQSPKSPSRRTT